MASQSGGSAGSGRTNGNTPRQRGPENGHSGHALLDPVQRKEHGAQGLESPSGHEGPRKPG